VAGSRRGADHAGRRSAEGRTPPWLYFAFLLYGTVAIALANAATCVVTSPWLPYYFWLTLYAAYFLGTVQVIVHQVLVACSVAISLWSADIGAEKPARFATHVLALAMTAFVVHRLRIEIAKLVGRLHAEASTDPLTGAYNRGTFDRDLVLELAHATAAHVPVALLLIDIDRFKAVNDVHGILSAIRCSSERSTCGCDGCGQQTGCTASAVRSSL
jgi:predicted signal transduction protein with EAL and GGDEF domain